MVKIVYCDRCEKEIRRSNRVPDGLMDDSLFDDISHAFHPNQAVLTQPHLCAECGSAFHKLVDGFNKQIEDFLKNEKNSKPKKKGVLSFFH